MDLKKCDKCLNELPFTATGNEITCPFCGERHSFNNLKVKNKPPRKAIHNNGSDSDIISSIVGVMIGDD